MSLGIFPDPEYGYLKSDQVKSVVADKLAEMGWIEKTWGMYAFVVYEKDGLTLSFRYKGGGYSYRRDCGDQPTQVVMHFRDRHYYNVSRRVSYKKFTFEWVEAAYETLQELKAADFQARDEREAHSRHLHDLRERASALRQELGMGATEIEAYKHATTGTYRYQMVLEDLTEDEVRDVSNLVKNLRALRPQKVVDSEEDPG